MRKRPVLSLCIATLNRADLLGHTLESIFSQANDQVELVVVDGGSTDHTPEVVERFQGKFENIQYLRLDEKGGVDQDFARAVSLAEGDFCWLFSDDDLLRPGAINAVLNAIDRGYSLIIVNSEVRDSSLTSIIEGRRLKLFADKEYSESEHAKLFAETASYLSFIGGVVIKKSIWDSRNIEDYFGTEFIHIGVIFQNPIPGKTLVLAHPFISIRYGNAQWSSRAIEIWLIKWPDLIWAFNGLPDQVKESVGKGKNKSWQLLKTGLLLRAQGIYNNLGYKKWIHPKIESMPQRVLMRIVANFPGYILNPLALTYFKRFSPSSGISLFDLRNSRYYLGNLLGTSTTKNPQS